MSPWAIPAALLGAGCYALASALQQHEASRATPSRSGLRLLVQLVTRPRWLLGVAATAVGAGLHVLALKLGPLALIQPIGVTGLLFALPLGAALHGHRVIRRDLLAAAAVIAGLVGLLARVQVQAGEPTISEPATALLAAVTGVAAGVATLAGRLLSGAARGVALALGAGIAFGATSALVRVVAHRAGVIGAEQAIPAWTTLVLVATAFLGLSLSQSAYQVGSLASVLPALGVADPVVAAVVGELLLGEPVTFTVAGAAGALASVLVILAAMVQLARAQTIPTHKTRAATNALEPGAAAQSKERGSCGS